MAVLNSTPENGFANVLRRWHRFTRTMPTVTVIKHFDVTKIIAQGAGCRTGDTKYSRAVHPFARDSRRGAGGFVCGDHFHRQGAGDGNYG